MVEFLCKVYKSYVNVISIIALFVMPIVGFVFFGKNFGGWEFNYGMAFLGGIIGFAGCFIFELLTIPPLMILFSIDSRIEKLENKNITNVNNETNFSEQSNKKQESSNSNLSSVWVCTKCGTTNPVGKIFCTNCHS